MDAVVELGERLVPVEMKAGQTVAGDFFSGLDRWTELAGMQSVRSWLVYAGNRRYTRQRTEVLPWRAIAELVAEVAG